MAHLTARFHAQGKTRIGFHFLGFRNLPYFELSDPGNLDQLIQEEVFPRLLHMLDIRPEPLPLFLPAKTTFAEDNQSRMDRYIEECDEVLRVRRNNRKAMIQCILPDNMIRSTR